jgi:hypothetical protein
MTNNEIIKALENDGFLVTIREEIIFCKKGVSGRVASSIKNALFDDAALLVQVANRDLIETKADFDRLKKSFKIANKNA